MLRQMLLLSVCVFAVDGVSFDDVPFNVSSEVQRSFDATGWASVLFMLPPMDLSDRKTAKTDLEAGALVTDLQAHARKSQARLITHCKQSIGCEVSRSYWISNTISAKVTRDAVNGMQTFTEVSRLVPNGGWKVELEMPDDTATMNSNASKSSVEPEWNVEWIKSTFLYQKGFKGKGMVIGNADTGIDYVHPALVKSYRGTLKSKRFQHNYNWFDATQLGPLPIQVNASSSGNI